MNISGKISSAQFRDVVLASWRLGRMERDIRAADMVLEIKRRLLAELQANAKADPPADGDREAEGGFSTDGVPGADSGRKRNGGIEAGGGFAAERVIEADVGRRTEGGRAQDNGRDPAAGRGSR